MVWNSTNDFTMSAMASQITGISMDCLLSRLFRRTSKESTLAFVRGIPRWPVDSPHKGPITRKMLPFDDVIMISFILRRPQHLSAVLGLSSDWYTFVYMCVCDLLLYYDERQGIRDHRQLDCFFNSLFRLTSPEISTLDITGRLWGESMWYWPPRGFLSQRVSKAKNGSMSWRHH